MELAEVAERVWQAVRRFTDRHIRLFAIVLAAALVPASLLVLTPAAIGWIAPPADPNLDVRASGAPATYRFLAADGSMIGRRGPLPGEWIRLDELPPYVPVAFISMEDRRFWHHPGIDLRGLMRAAWLDLRAGHYVAGGSSISQQTAKILYADQRRTLSRKLRELWNAERLERGLGKRRILEIYLNRLYLGEGAFGVDAAAHAYFGISARQLSLPQAAMLAALTRAPSVYTPRRNLAATQARARLVLAAMRATGAITAEEEAAARENPATIVPRQDRDTHSYFLDAAADEVQRHLGQSDAGLGALVIHTTLDPKIESAAESAATDVIGRQGRKARASQAAIVAMSLDGAVRAMVGGIDYRASVFDRVTQAHRQPGSAFKPFVYMAALESGITPWDQRDDNPVDINGYAPGNFHNASYGRIRLIDALAHSVNTVTVNLAQEVGLANVAGAAHRLGIISPLQQNPSLALGTNEVTPLELTAAYAAFANGGNMVHPYLVSAIEQGGVTLYRHAETADAVIGPDIDRDMVAMLAHVVDSGTGAGARLPDRESAGKTGTTQDSRDAWFIGFTTDYVTGVWVGNDDNSPMRGVTGGSLPAMIWKATMLKAEQGLPARPLDKSSPPADLAPQAPDDAVMAGDDESIPAEMLALSPDSQGLIASGAPAHSEPQTPQVAPIPAATPAPEPDTAPPPGILGTLTVPADPPASPAPNEAQAPPPVVYQAPP
jgi:penicillin-binding protein 1A